MLQAIRDNAQGVIIWIIVVLVILGLSSFILSSYMGSNVKSYVAKVNDVEISNQEFTMAFNNRTAMLQQQLGDNFARFFNEKLLRTSVIKGLVDSELLSQLTHEAGLRNSAEQAKKSLAKIKIFQGDDGKFSNQKFSDIVAQYGYTPEAYAFKQAISLSEQQYMSGITDSAFSLRSTVTDLERLTKQQRDVGLLSVSLAEVIKNIQVKDNEVKAWFEQHASEFMTQEKVKVDYIELSLTDLAKKQDVDEDEVKQYYEKNRKNYTKDDYSEAKKKIEAIARRIKHGESFEKLAKELSQDVGTAKNGGDLGFFGKGIMDPAFEQAVYKLKKGEVSKPVKTSFGYHLIKLEDIKGDQRRARHILIKKGKIEKSYDEVKAIITSTLRLQKAERIFYEDQTKLENLTYQYQDSLEPAAEALDLPIKTSPFFAKTGGPQMFRNTDLLREAFSEEVLGDLLNSNVIKLSEDDFVVIRLKEHQPAKQKPFEEVKTIATNRLRQEKAKQQVASLAEEYRNQLSNGSKAETLASEHAEVSWQNYGFIGREARFDQKPPAKDDKTAATSLSPDVRKAIFSLQQPENNKSVYHDMSAASGDGVVIVLRAVRDNPEKTDEKTLDDIQKQLTQSIARTDAAVVIDFMRARSKIDIPQTKEEDDL